MAVDLFANAANTTLSAAIGTAGSTSFTVTSGVKFPTVSVALGTQFRVIIDSELFIVTDSTTATWTVTPAAEGTTAATHLVNAPVTAIATAGAFAPLSKPSRYVTAMRTAGNVTVTSTTLVDFDAALDLIITAAAGDVLQVCAAGQAGAANNQSLSFNVLTLNTSLVEANRLGGAGTAGSLSGWGFRKNDFYPGCFAAAYTVQAGDVFSGKVRLRLQAYIDAAGSFTVFSNNTGIPFKFWAFNLGALTA